MSKAKNLISITLVGRLLADPIMMEVGTNKDNRTVKVTDHNRSSLQNIRPVTNFPIRVTQDFGGDVDFEVSCWGAIAGIGKILNSGRLVAVTTDNIRPKIWEATNRSTGEIKCGINLFINAVSCVVMDNPSEKATQSKPQLPASTPIGAEEEIPF